MHDMCRVRLLEYPPTATAIHGDFAGVIQPKAHRRRGERRRPGMCPVRLHDISTLVSSTVSSECKTHAHVFLIRLERIQTLHDFIAKKPQKTHTVPGSTDRFCGADTSQEIETATDAGCKDSAFLMSRPTATFQLLVHTLLYQWHSDFRTLVLQLQYSAPHLDNRYLHNVLKTSGRSRMTALWPKFRHLGKTVPYD